LTGYITEGQIFLSRDLQHKNIYPPIDVLQSLSRLMQRGIGEGHTREDHSAVSKPVVRCLCTRKGSKRVEIVLGEAALTDLDRLYVKFADRLESEFIAQGEDENRTIEETLAIGWRLLRMLPRSEL